MTMPPAKSFLLLAALCHIGLPLEYTPSRQYLYRYDTHVAFNEPNLKQDTQAKKDVGFRFTADVQLTPVWNTNNKLLVRLVLSEAKVESVGWNKAGLEAKSLIKFPLFFHWEGSHVVRVYTASKDSVWAANMKVAIASLLQLQRDVGQRKEVDISGECDVDYHVDGSTVTKTKSNCQPLQTLLGFSNAQKLLDVDWSSESRLRYEIQDDIIQSVTGTETFTSRVNIQDTIGAQAALSQSLTLDKVVSGASKVQASTLEEAVAVISTRERLNLEGWEPVARVPSAATCDGTRCTGCAQCMELSKLVESHRSSLEVSSVSSPEAASAFLELVAALREADQSTVAALLKDERFDDIILPLIDVITAAQTSGGQAAMMDFLDFTETYDISLPERYLLGVAFSTHPSERLLIDLFDLYRRDVADERLRDSIGDAMGAVLFTYCHQGNQHDKIVHDIESAVLEKLSGCERASCSCMQLRVLANAGLPGTVDTLMTVAEVAKEAAVSEAAIRALRRMDYSVITPPVKSVLQRIFHQEKRSYDSAVRTAALRVLLDDSNVSAEEVQAILASTAEPGQGELAMYIQARLRTVAQDNPSIRQHIKSALKDISLSNYHILGPKGKSLAFKEAMAETASVVASYDMFVENSKSGIMKRSGMDVEVTADNHSLPLYSFGIFAAGLEGLIGEEVEPGQEDVEATAGLALNLIDVSLRPVTFFTGQSGLMSAVWNAPSELMSALQANILLQDTVRHVPLLNGLLLKHTVQGAVSLDLSGLVSISLWNKNCHSLIKNSGAVVVQGSLAIDGSAFKTGINYTASGVSVIDFTTDVDFYDKLKMCLQMGRPAFTFKHHVTKYESAIGFKKGYTSRIIRTTAVNAASYPLPKANNEQCRTLLADNS